jgi:hypothetical protein
MHETEIRKKAKEWVRWAASGGDLKLKSEFEKFLAAHHKAYRVALEEFTRPISF